MTTVCLLSGHGGRCVLRCVPLVRVPCTARAVSRAARAVLIVTAIPAVLSRTAMNRAKPFGTNRAFASMAVSRPAPATAYNRRSLPRQPCAGLRRSRR